MANDFKINQSTAIAMMTAFRDAVDAGTAAVINIYSGTAPANLATSPTGTLLAQLTCSATSAPTPAIQGSGASETARMTFSAITADSSADATGTAGYFRIATQAGGTDIAQGTVGAGAGFDLVLNTTAISAGSQVSITSALVDLPTGSS